MTRTLETNERTLSNSESSSASIVPRFSCANVLRSKSFSSVPRLRLWYTRRARVVSMDSPGRGSGFGGDVFAGDVVEAMCSGVWGIVDHGSSFRLTDEEENSCVLESRNLGRNARMRETKWCRKIDMVLWMMSQNHGPIGCNLNEGHVNTFNRIREKHLVASHSMNVVCSG